MRQKQLSMEQIVINEGEKQAGTSSDYPLEVAL